eukprot:scaffold9196_cov110-Isochrysis_galbana.AAC.13
MWASPALRAPPAGAGRRRRGRSEPWPRLPQSDRRPRQGAGHPAAPEPHRAQRDQAPAADEPQIEMGKRRWGSRYPTALQPRKGGRGKGSRTQRRLRTQIEQGMGIRHPGAPEPRIGGGTAPHPSEIKKRKNGTGSGSPPHSTPNDRRGGIVRACHRSRWHSQPTSPAPHPAAPRPPLTPHTPAHLFHRLPPLPPHGVEPSSVPPRHPHPQCCQPWRGRSARLTQPRVKATRQANLTPTRRRNGSQYKGPTRVRPGPSQGHEWDTGQRHPSAQCEPYLPRVSVHPLPERPHPPKTHRLGPGGASHVPQQLGALPPQRRLKLLRPRHALGRAAKHRTRGGGVAAPAASPGGPQPQPRRSRRRHASRASTRPCDSRTHRSASTRIRQQPKSPAPCDARPCDDREPCDAEGAACTPRPAAAARATSHCARAVNCTTAPSSSSASRPPSRSIATRALASAAALITDAAAAHAAGMPSSLLVLSRLTACTAWPIASPFSHWPSRHATSGSVALSTASQDEARLKQPRRSSGLSTCSRPRHAASAAASARPSGHPPPPQCRTRRPSGAGLSGAGAGLPAEAVRARCSSCRKRAEAVAPTASAASAATGRSNSLQNTPSDGGTVTSSPCVPSGCPGAPAAPPSHTTASTTRRVASRQPTQPEGSGRPPNTALSARASGRAALGWRETSASAGARRAAAACALAKATGAHTRSSVSVAEERHPPTTRHSHAAPPSPRHTETSSGEAGATSASSCPVLYGCSW